MRYFHNDHHAQNTNTLGWHWSNLFLFNDTWLSTIDLWLTEVIPTILFCWLVGEWWIFIGYYLWAAFLQENIEHNKNIDLYPLFTGGKWHLEHHHEGQGNYGLFTPFWDWLFGTLRKENAN